MSSISAVPQATMMDGTINLSADEVSICASNILHRDGLKYFNRILLRSVEFVSAKIVAISCTYEGTSARAYGIYGMQFEIVKLPDPQIFIQRRPLQSLIVTSNPPRITK